MLDTTKPQQRSRQGVHESEEHQDDTCHQHGRVVETDKTDQQGHRGGKTEATSYGVEERHRGYP